MIPIPSFLINFVAFRILKIGLGWVGNTIVGGGGGGGGVSVVDDLPPPVVVSVPPLFLPEQVLIEILVRLPVVSLLRFKSVCKSWRDLIQTPFFIHLHATTTTFNSSSSSSCSKFGHNTFILQISPFTWVGGRLKTEQSMFMLSLGSGGSNGSGDDDDIQEDSGSGDDDDIEEDSGSGNDDDDDIEEDSGSGDDDDDIQEDSGSGDDDDIEQEVVFKMDNLGLPPYFTYMKIKMVGSCNGLICLYDAQLRDVYLWNPATRQFRILPKSITIQEKEEKEKDLGNFIAFGFDVKTKDYKVVQINRRFKRTGGIAQSWVCRVQVYSLSTDSWRLLEGINCLPADPNEDYLFNHGLYLNGSYFFVGRKCATIEDLDEQEEIRHDYLILSFDFTKEIFTTIQLPVHDSKHDFLLTQLGGDKIALFAIRMKLYQGGSGGDDYELRRRDCGDDYEYYDIWVLDEQEGGKESWVKLHSLRIKESVVREWMLPRGILNNGEFALIETKNENPVGVGLSELHLLNLVTKEPVKSFPIREKVARADIYKQSLVSIIGGNGTAATNRVVGGGAMFPIVNQG